MGIVDGGGAAQNQTTTVDGGGAGDIATLILDGGPAGIYGDFLGVLPAPYLLDFSSLDQDLVARGRSRLLTQFKNSPVLTALLDAFSGEAQELSDAINDVIRPAAASEQPTSHKPGCPDYGFVIPRFCDCNKISGQPSKASREVRSERACF